MNTLTFEIEQARAESVTVDDEALVLQLVDGRTISVPLAWYPRLWYGTTTERQNFELFGDGEYIHWPDLDEDLTVTGIVAGKRSGESQNSLKRWLEQRNSPKAENPDTQ